MFAADGDLQKMADIKENREASSRAAKTMTKRWTH